MKHLVFILLLFPFAIRSQSKNLLPDPSIEDTVICSVQYPFENLRYWYDPTESEPVALVYCNQFLTASIASPHSGYGAALVYVYYTSSTPSNQREYIASPLSQTLIANKKYCIDFYTIATKPSKYGCNSLGVYFGAGHQYYNTYTVPPVIPQSDTLLAQTIDSTKWFHYMDIYTATGNETDLIIGNFRTDTQFSYPIINANGGIWNGAAFAFDDISLYEMSIDAGNDAVTCPENMIATIGETNTDTLFKSYYWYDEHGVLFDSVKAQIQVQPTINTFYVQEKRVCGQSFFDTVQVHIDTVCPVAPPTPEVPFIIPNVFSPNGDGINDTWKVDLAGNRLKSATVYNRWGIAVFSTNDLNSTDTKTIIWEGRTTSGIACNEGVYYYILELTNTLNETKNINGYISLIK